MAKTALITGASSGFGLEFARLFARDGINLVITAKPGDGIDTAARTLNKEFPKIKVHHVELNLSASGAPEKLHAWIRSRHITISYLVNNAGIGLYGRFADHSLPAEQELINLNVVALSELCHLFIPDMVRSGDGKILNIASIAGFQAGPYYATYFASKGYVLLFSEALHYEYATDNITITTLCPGVARTGFFKRAAMREDSRLLQTYLMDPVIVAKAGYRGMMKGKTLIIPGTRNRFVATGYRVLPRSLINRITERVILTAAEKSHRYNRPKITN